MPYTRRVSAESVKLPVAAHELIDARGVLRTFPHRHGLDGFFAVRMTRR